jgi:predicted transporter
VTTVAYAILVASDWRTAAVFAANTACCLFIVGIKVSSACGFALLTRGSCV